MRLHKKAFYNLLRFHFLKGELTKAEPWEVEDLRNLSTHDLFNRLQDFHISLDAPSFLEKSNLYPDPETLTDSLLPLNRRHADPIYLILFELWRRLNPHKKSLSLFCDELDYQITLYYQKEPILEEVMQDLLKDLKTILDDSGGDPKTVFENFSLHCAHDLENFLYVYISILLQQNLTEDAAVLIQDFYPYSSNPLWFDFLKAKLTSQIDPHASNLLLQTLLEEAEDLDLLLEMVSFLINHGDPHLFQKAAKQALNLVYTEDDLEKLLCKVAAYFRCMDKEKEEKNIQALLDKRVGHDLDQVIDPDNPALKVVEHYLDAMLAPPPL